MLKNYFKIAVRNITRNKLHSFILIFGLSISMASCILLLEYVSYQWSYDHFHENGDKIYRIVNTRFQNGKQIQKGTITYPTIGPTMTNDFPEVEQFCRLAYGNEMLLKKPKGEVIRLESALYASQQFFNIFSFPLLAGDANTALAETNKMAISRSLANKLYDVKDEDFTLLIGKNLEIDNDGHPYQISAVFEDFPANSSLKAEALGSYKSIIRYWGAGADDSWEWSDFYHFLQLKPGANVAALEAKFHDFSQQYFDEATTGVEEVFELQAFQDAHLNSAGLEYELLQTSNGKSIAYLLLIAIIILIIAWINYVNLSSVRAMEKAKEVGVRKVIGADRKQLVYQFLVEAFLVNVISLFLAFGIIQIAQSTFNQILDISLSFNYLFQLGSSSVFYLLIAMFTLLILGIFSSGAYPAFLLARQNVSEVLKGVYKKSIGSAYLRKTLVIFQFVASIVLIACTGMVYQQLSFMNQQNLGVNIDQIIQVNPPSMTNWDSTFINKVNTFKNALKQYPDVLSASATSRLPGQGTGRIFEMRNASEKDGTSYMSNFINADYDYANTFNLTPIAGRNFRVTDHSTDGQLVKTILLNESAVKMFGFQEAAEAIGQKINFWNRDWEVIGVLPNFHQLSLHHSIEPITFIPFYGNNNPLAVKVSGQNMESTIAHIEETYQQFFPNNLFEFSFLDERFQRQYDSEQLFGKLLIFFTLLAVLIACLGLFGLSSYTAFLRTKEIGIRKVLGSSVSSIVILLSKDFILLIFISMLIAFPLAWYVSKQWLQNFHYQMEISWWIFAIAGTLALAITLLTVSYQSMRAALVNPVEALKNE